MRAEVFSKIVLSRRSARHFRPDPLPDGLLEELLAVTQRAPTGYNLQPWVAIVVRDPEQKKALRQASLGQAQVEEAPATVVFAADTQLMRYLERTIALNVAASHWDEAYAQGFLRRFVQLKFQGGPLRVLQPLKAITAWLGSWVRPTPMFPVGRQGFERYVTKQVIFAAATFMYAAASHGLATCPMEGIDARRVRRLVGLPRRFCVPVIIPVGLATELPHFSPRFPPHEVFFEGQFGCSMRGITALEPETSSEE